MKKKFDVDKWFNPSKELLKASELIRFFQIEMCMTKETSRICALKVVDEILNELDLQNHLLRDYWYNVKHEIEQL